MPVLRAESDGNGDGEPTEESEKFHASRTIVNHVMSSGEGVLSSNAMTDQRFSKGKSVHNLGIRSALCVPIKMRRLERPATIKGAPSTTGSAEDIARTCHAHPTLSEATREAALAVDGRAIHS